MKEILLKTEEQWLILTPIDGRRAEKYKDKQIVIVPQWIVNAIITGNIKTMSKDHNE